MIIVTADSAAEAADLHDLLGRHLAWRHRIYVGGAEYRPEEPATADLLPPGHELMRQVLREAGGPLANRDLVIAMAERGIIVTRGVAYGWLRADAAAGLVRETGRVRDGRPSWTYAWTGDRA